MSSGLHDFPSAFGVAAFARKIAINCPRNRQFEESSAADRQVPQMLAHSQSREYKNAANLICFNCGTDSTEIGEHDSMMKNKEVQPFVES
jgi:hypothetical protein